MFQVLRFGWRFSDQEGGGTSSEAVLRIMNIVSRLNVVCYDTCRYPKLNASTYHIKKAT